MRCRILSACLLAVLPFGAASGEELAQNSKVTEIEKGAPVTPHRIDVDLRDLPQVRGWKVGDPLKEIPIRTYLPQTALSLAAENQGPDPLVDRQRAFVPQTQRGSGAGFTTPTRNFGGQGFSGVNPPDTVGDIGPNYFIQSINTGGGADVRIWNKAEPPSVVTTFRMDNLGTGACASGFGDPIVLYDRQAERWLITEFAGSGNHLCVYVSQSADPVSGGWYAYDFTTATFPDYPKYAVWATDANGGDGSYIVTANDGGPGVYALNRGPMLTGDASSFIRIGMPGLPGFGIQGPAPADPDGPNGPPAGTPAMVMRHRDTELHGSPSAPGDVLEMWEFQVDWQNTGNTTLQLVDNVDVSDFDSTTCGTIFGGCFDQPNTGTRLFPIREVIMNRLQYYKHADFETLVGNFVVDVGGDQGGIRWFELRRNSPTQAWTTYQEGTWSIDSDNRWMAGVAMDQSQNIAMAYTVASSSTFPSLRYTGRQASDTLGLMTQGENSISESTASNSSERWGDYAAMGLDPSDDCTFWFTSMNNFSSSWRTHNASFKFDACGCLQQPLPPVVTAEAIEANQIVLNWADSELDTVTDYIVSRSRDQAGPYSSIAFVSDLSPGLANSGSYEYVDADVSGGVTYYYRVDASDGVRCLSESTADASAIGFGSCSLRPIFNGLDSISDAIGDTCAVGLSWSPAAAECGGPVAYNVYRSSTPGFAPDASTLLAGGEFGTSITDVNALIEGQSYYYVVRAVDLGNGVEDLNSVEFEAQAAGLLTGVSAFVFEDFESGAALDDWTITTGPGIHTCGEWALQSGSGSRPSGGSGQYAIADNECGGLLGRTSSTLTSPETNLDIPGLLGVELKLDVYFNYASGNGSESGTIEYWNGSQWIAIWNSPNSDVNQTLSFDLTAGASGVTDFKIRVDYQDATRDRWFSIDDYTILVDVFNACSTSVAPAAAGAGLGSSSQLTAAVDGAGLDVSFDASCGATEYNLLYGDLSDVSSLSLSGSECSIGTSGTFDWTVAPAGNLFFIVVGTDDSGTESSWGPNSLGERNGLTPSGECAVTTKEITNVCE